MATPVSIDSPPTGHVRTRSEQERDLQEKVQHMISLQYQQQRLSNSNLIVEGEATEDHAFRSQKDDRVPLEGSGFALSKSQFTKTNSNLLRLESAEDKIIGNKPLHPSSGDVNTDIPISKELLDIGMGTIVFSDNLLGSKYATDSGNIEDNDKSHTLQQQYLRQDETSNNQQFQQNKIELSPHSTTLGSQQQQNLLSSQLNQQFYSTYGSVQEENNNFHYGNPDYENIDEQEFYYDEGRQQDTRGIEKDGLCARLCACWYRPIADMLSQENLHRSFCYGAIDGLLTGSGICSAFWGLGLLSVRTRVELRIAVVVFTIAACVADSLCMAMGHIWTTYIVTSNHAWERSYERQLLERDKADSKGKLVDMLLARGMLKIDAMSLADTLEGYPDLFVSALVGDSLLSSGIQDSLLDEQTDIDQEQQQRQDVRSPMYSDPATTFDAGEGFLSGFRSWKFPSNYDFDSGGHQDLEIGHVRVVYQESQKEGLFMMTGFASFAIVPSLLWLILPQWFNTDSSISYAGVDDGESVNVPSLIILVLSGVVWCLGVWKSRFVDSNWVVFGLETIAVLIVCISSAYGIAALLVYCTGLDNLSNDDKSIINK